MIAIHKDVVVAGADEGNAVMEENGSAEGAGQSSVPVLMAVPVRPQRTWTLEPEYARFIKGGQVCLHRHCSLPWCHCSVYFCSFPSQGRQILNCSSALSASTLLYAEGVLG